jgi:hypothetical protein
MSFLPPAIAAAGEQLLTSTQNLANAVGETIVDVVFTPGVVTGALDLAGGIASLVTCALHIAAEAPVPAAAVGGVVAVDETAVQAVVNLLDLLTQLSNATTQQLVISDPTLGPLVADFLQFVNTTPLKFASTIVCDLA